MGKSYNFFLAGVGGQGTILASNVLAEVALAAGFDVKKSEVHGMAQRGGSVNTMFAGIPSGYIRPSSVLARPTCCWPLKKLRRCAMWST